MARYRRRVFRIRAEDSPNVRLARAQQAAGIAPTDEELVPGVLGWGEYQKRRATWDVVRQTVGLDACFYEGAQQLLYPPLWLDRAEELARSSAFLLPTNRRALGLGVDSAEGGDKSSWAVAGAYGLLHLRSESTPDTSVIPQVTLALMREWGIPPERVCFDRGGGGKEHADRLRSMGHPVRSVGFGEAINAPIRPGVAPLPDRREHAEERYVYVSRRAQMMWELRLVLDPAGEGVLPDWRTITHGQPGKADEERVGGRERGFAIPQGDGGACCPYTALRHQMAPIPVLYDGEGRIRMLPKRRKDRDSDEKCLEELIGRSPDELDAVILALHAVLHKGTRVTVGALR